MTGIGLRGAPRSVVAVAAAAVLLLALPMLALVQRAPWSELTSLLTRREVVDALGVSLVVSLLAAASSVLRVRKLVSSNDRAAVSSAVVGGLKCASDSAVAPW